MSENKKIIELPDEEVTNEEIEDLDDDWDGDEDELEDEEDDEDLEPMEMDSNEKVSVMVAAADSIRAEEIVVLDLRELTTITDYFMVCTGNSSIQIRSIAEKIEEKLRDLGLRKLHSEGFQEATWILLDYSDVIVHVMSAEKRDFYQLEARWAEAPRIEVTLLPKE